MAEISVRALGPDVLTRARDAQARDGYKRSHPHTIYTVAKARVFDSAYAREESSNHEPGDAARWIAKRYGLAPHMATTVASLAFAGGAR